MVYARGESGFGPFLIRVWSEEYAANSLTTSFVAKNSETARISLRGTPRKKVTG